MTFFALTDEQQMINTVHLQVYGNEQNLLFLPADRREAALQVLFSRMAAPEQSGQRIEQPQILLESGASGATGAERTGLYRHQRGSDRSGSAGHRGDRAGR